MIQDFCWLCVRNRTRRWLRAAWREYRDGLRHEPIMSAVTGMAAFALLYGITCAIVFAVL